MNDSELFADMITRGRFGLGGRGPKVWDCLGATLEACRRIGLDVPDPFSWPATRSRWGHGDEPAEDDWPPGWMRTGAPWRRGDALVLVPTHSGYSIALALGPGTALLASQNAGIGIRVISQLRVAYGLRPPGGPAC